MMRMRKNVEGSIFVVLSKMAVQQEKEGRKSIMLAHTFIIK